MRVCVACVVPWVCVLLLLADNDVVICDVYVCVQVKAGIITRTDTYTVDNIATGMQVSHTHSHTHTHTRARAHSLTHTPSTHKHMQWLASFVCICVCLLVCVGL